MRLDVDDDGETNIYCRMTLQYQCAFDVLKNAGNGPARERRCKTKRKNICNIAYTRLEHNTTTFSVRWPRANAKSKIVPTTDEIDANHSGNGVILIFIFFSLISNRIDVGIVFASYHSMFNDHRFSFGISCIKCHRKVFWAQNSSVRIRHQFADKKKLFSTINIAKIIFSIKN